MSQTISITVHAASNMPEKMGTLHKTSPYVILWMMKDKYTTRTVKDSGPEASWEETATFQWDGTSHLAIDLLSKSDCFGKAWLNLNQYFGTSGEWKGILNLSPHCGVANPPKLLVTMKNHSFVKPNKFPVPGRR